MKIQLLLRCRMLFYILLCCFTSINAQWQFEGSPETGKVNHFDIDGNRIYVCATSGLFFSDNEGNSWLSIPLTKEISTANEIYAEDGTLFLFTKKDYLLGDYPYDIFRSIDQGITWENIFPFSTSYIFTMHSPLVKGDTLLLFADDSIAVSTNKGESFTISYNTLSEIEHAIFHDDSLLVVKNDSLYSSTDLGSTWHFVYAAPTTHFGLNVISIDTFLFKLELEYNNADFTYFITRSNNGGSTWVDLGSYNYPFIVFPSFFGDIDNLFLFSSSIIRDLFRSSDGGKTWELIDNKLGALNFSFLNKLLFGHGIYNIQISKDKGETFEIHNEGFNAANISGIAGNEQHVWCNANEGVFEKLTGNQWQNHSNIKNIESTDDGFLIAFIDAVPNRSSDGGNSWSTIPSSAFGLNSYDSIYRLLAVGNIFFATGSESFYSLDQGLTWSTFDLINQLDHGLSHVGYGSSNYVVADYRGDVLKSTNGTSWEKITYDLNSFGNNRIKMIHSHGGYFFATIHSGTFRLSPGSTHWIKIIDPFPVSSPRSPDADFNAMISYDTLLIGASYGHGVFVSKDNGNTWTDFNIELNDFQTLVLKIINNQLFLGVDGGIWRHNLYETNSIHNVKKEDLLSLVATPSPVINILNVKIPEHAVSMKLTLTLYDSKGVFITSQTSQNEDHIQLDVSELPSGIYFLAAKTGDRFGIIKVIKSP